MGPGFYQVLLKATSNYGCYDTVSQTIFVNESPVAVFEFTEGCLYDSIQFTDLSIAPDTVPISSWTWMMDEKVYTSQHPVHKFAGAGTYDIDLVVRAENLCESSDSSQIFIPELPVASFISENKCLNETILFSSTSSSLQDPIIGYVWAIEDLEPVTGQEISNRFNENGDYRVQHWVLTERGCLDTLSEVKTIFSSPEVAFSYFPEYGAAPLEVEFTNETTGATTYLWKFSDQDKTTSMEQHPFFIYTETGIYRPLLTAMNDAGCMDSIYTQISVVTPRLDIALIQVNKLIVGNQISIILTITNQGTILVDDMDVQIDINGGTRITEHVDEIIAAGQTINHQLSFSVSNNPGFEPEYICFTLIPNVPGEEEADLSNNSECITENDGFYFFQPYPNPARDEINIPFYLAESEPITILISDLNGKILQEKNISETKEGLNMITIFTDQFKEGIYLISTSGNSFSEVRRFNIVK